MPVKCQNRAVGLYVLAFLISLQLYVSQVSGSDDSRHSSLSSDGGNNQIRTALVNERNPVEVVLLSNEKDSSLSFRLIRDFTQNDHVKCRAIFSYGDCTDLETIWDHTIEPAYMLFCSDICLYVGKTEEDVCVKLEKSSALVNNRTGSPKICQVEKVDSVFGGYEIRMVFKASSEEREESSAKGKENVDKKEQSEEGKRDVHNEEIPKLSQCAYNVTFDEGRSRQIYWNEQYNEEVKKEENEKRNAASTENGYDVDVTTTIPKSATETSGMEAWKIALIIGACALFVLLAISIGLFCYFRNCKNESAENQEEGLGAHLEHVSTKVTKASDGEQVKPVDGDLHAKTSPSKAKSEVNNTPGTSTVAFKKHSSGKSSLPSASKQSSKPHEISKGVKMPSAKSGTIKPSKK